MLPVEHECFEYMMRVHLEGFLATPEYRQLVRSGRRTVLLMYYQLKTGDDRRGCGGGAAVYLGTSAVTAALDASLTSVPVESFPETNSPSFDALNIHVGESNQEIAPNMQPMSPQLHPPFSAASPVARSNHQPQGGKHGVNTMDSVELTAWLARGGRHSGSTYTASSGSTQLGPGSPVTSELFPPVSHADMRELKNFIRYILKHTLIWLFLALF